MLGEGPTETMDTLPPLEPQLDAAPASGGGHRVPVVVVVSLGQGQRQRQAGLPFQLFLLRAVLWGPNFEEVGDVPDLAEKRKAGAAWGEQDRPGRLGTVGQGSPGVEGCLEGSMREQSWSLRGRWEHRARVWERRPREGRGSGPGSSQ